MFRAPCLRALRRLRVSPSPRLHANQSGRVMCHNDLQKISTGPITANLWKEDRRYIFLATLAVGSFGIHSTLCEQANANGNNSNEEHELPYSGSTIPRNENGSENQLYEELPDEDEPTTCTICLINRQGPCRPHWRKFERCMKDNSPNDTDDEGNSESPSMSEKCDQFMLPWIRCIQKYRNKYTLISNAFFQKEMIEEIEKSVEKGDMVLLDSIDLASIVQIGREWKEHVDVKTVEVSAGSAEFTAKDNISQDSASDDILVEGVARINMWDRTSGRHIEIAYLKDQDGALLGYDQFSDFKKSVEEISKSNVEEAEKKSLTSEVGTCNFHVNPKTTKFIQIFALYRSREENPVADTNNEHINTKEDNGEKNFRTLFYSPLIPVNNVPIEAEEAKTM